MPYFTAYFLTILGVEVMYEEFLTGVLERLVPTVLLWNSIKLIIKIIIPLNAEQASLLTLAIERGKVELSD